LLFFLVLFLSAQYPYEHGFPSDLFLRFSPLIPLFNFIDNLNFPFIFLPAFLILVASIFFGRFFCGWICPLGTSLDIFDRLFKTPSNKKSARFSKFRWLKFGILMGTVVMAIFSMHIWSYFDPLAIFMRICAILFYPIFTLFTEASLIFSTKMPFLETPGYILYDLFKNNVMPHSQSFFQGVFGIILLTLIIFGLEKLSKRFWCRNICPAGAFMGLLSQIRPYERIVGDTCPLCNKCQIECKMNAIPEGNIKETNKVECIECFNCGEKCPPKSKSITYRFRWTPYRSIPDFSRRQFIGSAFTGILTLGLVGIGYKHKTSTGKLIRPPGAIPENDFMDKCIRCLACVRICESNGKCLQPAGFENDITHLWTPIAVMREGYCEYNCNLCGQICPTDAILPLSLEQKKKTPMGLAYFDKNLCIPFVRHEDCIVCEEHCPTPDKAIKFEIKEAILPDGSSRKVKYPYVIRALCIGCGICEEKCPLPNLPGVFVTRENELRLDTPTEKAS
jgi:polyferredoxin